VQFVPRYAIELLNYHAANHRSFYLISYRAIYFTELLEGGGVLIFYYLGKNENLIPRQTH